jgi:hypothetical protein
MKNLFYIIIGIISVTMISATTASVMTIKPAKPTSVAVVNVDNIDIPKTVSKYVKEGYKVHSVTNINNYRATIIMEKY